MWFALGSLHFESRERVLRSYRAVLSSRSFVVQPVSSRSLRKMNKGAAGSAKVCCRFAGKPSYLRFVFGAVLMPVC